MNFKRIYIAMILMVCVAVPGHLHAAYKPEEVLAVYVFRIANFINWPDEASMTSLNFCVEGDKQIARLLDVIIQGKTIRSMPLALYPGISEKCNVLFVSKKSLLSQDITHSDSMVTISDSKRFTERGGVIALVPSEGRIKPKINIDNIGSYSISSSLLRISIIEGGSQDD
ncbi:YfiR family protein [Vibrio paucivorans]|uniref:YfiR family protein n=1 Tax=Vibrio paucivorans TaxID=2829489 RepID=A0A9X3CFK8_9VIBR|nr:YfiR family protein [Vibrio paucivorans]MCW8334937.1 YfiR family protein [Vibrio paucivorans]